MSLTFISLCDGAVMKETEIPLLTFYMTVKNGIPFIKDSVSSIQHQTYSNIEVVIVDDGSEDGTVEYLKEIECQDARFRIIVTGGVGRGKALNIALDHAKGQYVANLDADDYTHPKRAEVQMSYLIKTGNAFVSAQRDILYDNERPRWASIENIDNISLADVTRQLFKGNPVCHAVVTMHRETVIALGGYDESRNSQFDYELWIRLAASGIKLLKLDQSLGCKRIHRDQSFENKKRLRYLLSSIRLQCAAITSLHGRFYHYVYPTARLFYGFLPQRIRSSVKQ